MVTLTKIAVFVLMLAILDVIKEAANFVIAFMNSQYLGISKNREILLFMSIAYILTIIFTGISII